MAHLDLSTSFAATMVSSITEEGDEGKNNNHLTAMGIIEGGFHRTTAGGHGGGSMESEFLRRKPVPRDIESENSFLIAASSPASSPFRHHTTHAIDQITPDNTQGQSVDFNSAGEQQQFMEPSLPQRGNFDYATPDTVSAQQRNVNSARLDVGTSLGSRTEVPQNKNQRTTSRRFFHETQQQLLQQQHYQEQHNSHQGRSSSFTSDIFRLQGETSTPQPRNHNERFSRNEKSRTEMGFQSEDRTWNARTPIKMEGTRIAGVQQDEGKRQEDDAMSAASTASATTLSPHNPPIQGHVMREVRLPAAAIGTPSTVSTAFSVEDHSVDGGADAGDDLDRLSLRMEDTAAQATISDDFSLRNTPVVSHSRSGAISDGNRSRVVHGRGSSWEYGPPHIELQPQQIRGAQTPSSQRVWGKQSLIGSPSHEPSHALPQRIDNTQRDGAWAASTSSGQVRVASFRSQDHHAHARTDRNGISPWNQRQHIGQTNSSEHANSSYQQRNHYATIRQAYNTPTSSSQVQAITPPRNRTRPTQKPHGSPSMSGTPGPSGPAGHSRSSSEVLKTLLRKKACLYEPDTSRAVALVTWLVGRELAIEHGYFSRQQLQSGVHACVAHKIDSGTITRTKVNRCMQIILNSCFHYIIPRPDGTEENGLYFKQDFTLEAANDAALLEALATPWDGIKVDRDIVLNAWSDEEKDEKKQHSPTASPQVGSTPAPSGDDQQPDSSVKRAVLLCFNENVRSADDVFRCHNEFIRDTANASKLQLTAQEWRAFFGKDALCLHGIRDSGCQDTDYLGKMSPDELISFRTTWCSKRYEHDHSLCGFAHVDVNGGWLRRDPAVFKYRPEMCESVVCVSQQSKPSFWINMCPRGRDCPFAHSWEEVIYHPQQYKKKVCKTATSSSMCNLGDICPDLHPRDSYHATAKKQTGDARSGYRRHHEHHHHHHRHHNHHHHHQGSHGNGVTNMPPEGSPMLYVNPAPLSSFEQHLALPGLQGLFRQNGAAVKAHLDNVGIRAYSLFGPVPRKMERRRS